MADVYPAQGITLGRTTAAAVQQCSSIIVVELLRLDTLCQVLVICSSTIIIISYGYFEKRAKLAWPLLWGGRRVVFSASLAHARLAEDDCCAYVCACLCVRVCLSVVYEVSYTLK